MDQQQFVQPPDSAPVRRGDTRSMLLALAAPLAASFIYWYWAALDDPPLPLLANCIVLGLIVATGVYVFRAACSLGVPALLSVVAGVLAVPCLMFAMSIVVIAGSFMLGGLLGG